jgi:hypothetical protein
MTDKNTAGVDLDKLPRAHGVSRDAESPGGKGILIFFERPLSDDELRTLQDILAHRAEPSVTEADERTLYEVWARTEGWSDKQLRRYGEQEWYSNPQVAHEWRVWQARAALASPAVSQQAAPVEPSDGEIYATVSRRAMEMARQAAPEAPADNLGIALFVLRKPGGSVELKRGYGDLPEYIRALYKHHPDAEITMVRSWSDSAGCQHAEDAREYMRLIDEELPAPAAQQAGAADDIYRRTEKIRLAHANPAGRSKTHLIRDVAHLLAHIALLKHSAATTASASEPDVFSCARAIPGSYSSACEAYCGDESKCISADCGIKRPNPVREAGDVPTKETLIAQPTEEMLSAMVERAANWGMNIDPRIAAALYRAALARAPLPAQGDTKPVSAGAKLYRKTALVQAEQFLPAEGKIPDGVISDGNGDPRKNSRYSFVLDTKEGRHYLRNGDYICTGPSGEKWNVERGIFESTYELADAAPAQAGDAQTQAARDVLAERRRQVEAEGWHPDQDDDYEDGQLSVAAACYAMQGSSPNYGPPPDWPWDKEWWKPTDDRRNLVKAGALILADIERIDRAAMSASQGKNDDGLTVDERAFVELVRQRPGHKLNNGEAFDADGNGLWTKPEALGLIQCVGSFKWTVPGAQKQSPVADAVRAAQGKTQEPK